MISMFLDFGASLSASCEGDVWLMSFIAIWCVQLHSCIADHLPLFVVFPCEICQAALLLYEWLLLLCAILLPLQLLLLRFVRQLVGLVG